MIDVKFIQYLWVGLLHGLIAVHGLFMGTIYGPVLMLVAVLSYTFYLIKFPSLINFCRIKP